jgi:hypothetical protein
MFGFCSGIFAPINSEARQSKMPRSSIRESIPQVDILGGLGKGLTHKQKRFAEEVAKGRKGSEAYRLAYNTKAKPKTQADTASKLKARPDIKQAIQAIEQANEAMKYQTAEGLRSLAVSSLVNVLIDPETSQAVKVQCARTIGNMTEVSLFTHRTESKVIHSSEDIKAKILKEITALMNGTAEDVIERDALSLLNELTAKENAHGDEPTAPAPATLPAQESPVPLHTIPQPQSQISAEGEPPLDDFNAA